MALCIAMSDSNLSKTDLESNLTDIVNDITKLKKWLNVFTTKEPIEVNSKMTPTVDDNSDQLKGKKAPKLTSRNNVALNKTTTKSSTDTKAAQTDDASSAPPPKSTTKKSTSTKKSTTKKPTKKSTTTKSTTKKSTSTKKSTTKKSTTTKKPKTAPSSKSKPKSAASTTKKTTSTKKGTRKAKSPTKTQNILEDELAETLTPEEIENFQIERVDMDKLTHKVCDLLIERESEGMLQADLYKKLKLSARNGARLSLKLERMGTVSRVKILENERWTYKLILKKTPVSTDSLNGAPCLTCAVEQRCSMDGEISPMTCPYIEDWVLIDLKRTRSK